MAVRRADRAGVETDLDEHRVFVVSADFAALAAAQLQSTAVLRF